uniref:CNH domain-containing protein n=1 Tax=Caenorhabditis tropicalis TaxID=1561998 RepID=A0A1I7T8W4_9PELO
MVRKNRRGGMRRGKGRQKKGYQSHLLGQRELLSLRGTDCYSFALPRGNEHLLLTRHKTLNEKLIEIGIEAGFDVSNMSQLRALLDQESQCLPCYRLHTHHDAVSVRECTCSCHHNTDKLLIFHGNDDRIQVKVITENILERARMAFLVRGEDMENNIDQFRLFSALPICTHFDTVDHVFKTGSVLSNAAMCFSPDHRYVYITGTRETEKWNKSFIEVKPICLDLETMVVKSSPDFKAMPWIDCDYKINITANKDFLAIFAGYNTIVWSAFHRGNPAAVLTEQIPVTSVALHPLKSLLAVTTETLIHYYQSPMMMRDEKDN